jgi:hypothetical protein
MKKVAFCFSGFMRQYQLNLEHWQKTGLINMSVTCTYQRMTQCQMGKKKIL